MPRRIAESIAAVHPPFPARRFLRQALDGYDALELTPRAWHIADALADALPADFSQAAAILVSSLGPPLDTSALEGMTSFLYLPHCFFVARYGAAHFEDAMAAQYQLTQRFTAEFSIRTFLERYPEQTLARLHLWADDESVHVRRLVSEGTRPRLPWAPVLRQFVADPRPVVELLEPLKDDRELYVRRSVANNLNDITKDHPEVVIDLCRRWSQDAGPERTWLIRHALRTLIKRGDPDALDILGFGSPVDVAIEAVTITPVRPRIGESVRITFELVNRGRAAGRVLVDLKVHFVKANGSTSPKVFKLTTADLAPGGAVSVRKTIALNQQTTRTHYPGAHLVEVVVNGRTQPVSSFELTD